MTGHRHALAAIAVVALFATAPTGVRGQLRRTGSPESTGWPPVEVGARVGYDNKQQRQVAGVLVRIPVLRSPRVMIVPSADVTFLRGFKEYQVNFEAVYAMGGQEGGLFAGGGAGFRSTMVPTGPGEPSSGRETLTTYSIVAGLSFGRIGRVSPLIEIRRHFASRLPVDPQQFMFGATFALW